MFCKIVQIVKGESGVPPTVLDVFAQQTFDKDIYIKAEMAFVFDSGIVVAQFQNFIFYDRSQFFGGKQKIVGFAKKFVVVVVLFYVFKKYVDKNMRIGGV